MTAQLLAQEQRRQAMLSVMQLDVWLPRQSLPYAAASSELLLSWDAGDNTLAATAQPPAQPVAHAMAGAGGAGQAASSDPRAMPAATPVPPQAATAPRGPSAAAAKNLQQVREQLQQSRQPAGARVASAPPPAAVVQAEPAPTPSPQAEQPAPSQPVTPQPAVTEAVPRFSLQLLRSGACLLLADLPFGEPLQARDPDYLLLKDLLRAAKLPVEPSMRFNGEPVRWPLLTTGALMHAQDAEAARVFVRDLLSVEVDQQPVSFIWLLGENAVRFANRADVEGLDEFSVTPFQAQVQCWNLPSLEQLLAQAGLKPLLWQHMQKLMPRWCVTDA